MKVLQGLFVLMASFMTSFAAHAQCPDLSKGETALDCPWADVTRSTEGITDSDALRKIIDEKIPGFMAQIDQDAKSKTLLNLWGMSRNIDESNLDPTSPNYMKHTVPENLLAFFVSIFKVPYDSTLTQGHAGLTHTYGYLFSTMPTPYGYKRARYVSGEIEEGFGISAGLFGGLPKEGTLLSNLTHFAGTIAFRDNMNSETELTETFSSGEIKASKELSSFNYTQLKPQRLTETAQNENFYLEIRTDIIPFTHSNSRGTDTALLIYSIDFRAPSDPAKPKLITAFPVNDAFTKGLFDPATLGDQQVLQLKYNAVLPVSVPAEKMIGKRYIFNEGN